MDRKDIILSRQDPLLKLSICLALIIISTTADFNKLLIIFSFTLLYFLVKSSIFLHWLKTILKILPFFISLFILGIIFSISFIDQCQLSVRILYVILISVYITRTSSIDSFFRNSKLMRYNLIQKLFFALAATVHFIPIFINKFEENRKKTKKLIDIIVNSLDECILEINNVEIAVKMKLQNENNAKHTFSVANIYFLVIIIPIFILYFY